MTTEVLRNMLYESSPTLDGLELVVMDEVHYLQDYYRGAVWEEILIHLPLSVAVVCLSATVSNAEEFGEWIAALRGPTRVVIEERRPVPLENLYMVGGELHGMNIETAEGRAMPNPTWCRSTSGRRGHPRTGAAAAARSSARCAAARARGTAACTRPAARRSSSGCDEEGMLPAIYFVFSRAGCDRSVDYVMESGVRLTDAARARPHPRDRRRADGLGGRGRPVRARLLETCARRGRPAWRRTTRGCCRCSRRRSRRCSRRGW